MAPPKLAGKIPNNPAAKGVGLMMQVGYGPTFTAPLGVDLSAGMKMTLGNRGRRGSHRSRRRCRGA